MSHNVALRSTVYERQLQCNHNCCATATAVQPQLLCVRIVLYICAQQSSAVKNASFYRVVCLFRGNKRVRDERGWTRPT